jgi:hypothetical protein
VLRVHGTVMESVTHDTYLGDVISGDGRNTKNVSKRISRGIGISSQIVNLLRDICLGEHYIEIALLLRESMFINSVLTNAEIWYLLKKEEIKQLEDLDKTLLKKILKVPFSTPGEAYFLELGILPLGVIIKARRLNYLHYIIMREESEMLFRFFMTQWNNEVYGDWTKEVKTNLEEFGIPCDLDHIRSMTTEKFKSLVKIKANEYALGLLHELQGTHSKMSDLYYPELKLQDYFKTPGIETKEILNLFKWRTRMTPLGENYRGDQGHILCPLCSNHLDNQPGLLQCEEIRKLTEIEVKMEDVWCERVNLKTAKKITEILEIREILMKEK